MTVRIIGQAKLLADLDKIPLRLEAKIGMQGLRAGATLLKKEVARTLPVDPTPDGVHLRESVAIVRHRSAASLTKRGGAFAMRIGYRGAARLYGHLVEFGSSRNAPRPAWRAALRKLMYDIAPVIAKKMAKDLIKESARNG